MTGVALTLALLIAGCGPITHSAPAMLRAGYNTLDGTLRVWPARGPLAADAQATAAVTAAVSAWRTPTDDRAYLPASGILWFGQVDGAPLALVAANVPNTGASWLLQVTPQGSGYQVSRATEYTDPGYLVYSDVLPVQLPSGRHYLTSARVRRLLGPANTPLTITDGLTGPVNLPSCTAVTVTATLQSTESLPNGETREKLLDFGTGISAPRYPIVGDESGSGSKALQGLNTCTLATTAGPFGSILRRVGGRDDPNSVPASWPIDRVSVRSLGDVSLLGDGSTRIEQLSWRTSTGVMNSVVIRAGNGAPVASAADRANALQTYVLSVANRKLLVLVWQASADNSLAVPPGTQRLVDLPGLVVVPDPTGKQTFSLATPDKMYYRTVSAGNTTGG
jgi:hypothetical protein